MFLGFSYFEIDEFRFRGRSTPIPYQFFLDVAEIPRLCFHYDFKYSVSRNHRYLMPIQRQTHMIKKFVKSCFDKSKESADWTVNIFFSTVNHKVFGGG